MEQASPLGGQPHQPTPTFKPQPISTNRRPTSVTVIGIIFIIFGCIATITFIIFLSMLSFISGSEEVLSTAASQNEIETLNYVLSFGMGAYAILILFAIFEIIIGVGLLKLQPWARIATIVVSILNILSIYPIIFIIFMFQQNVKEAFSRNSTAV